MRIQNTIARGRAACLLLLGLVQGTNGGCMNRELTPLNPCLVSGVTQSDKAKGVDKVDLLFAVDNSKSMIEEQAKLRTEIPNLVATLTLGQRKDDTRFPPAKDLHLAVITTDLGVPGLSANLAGECDDEGDNGLMLTTSKSLDADANVDQPDLSCQTVQLDPNKRFLEYRYDNVSDPVTASADVVHSLGCLAQVGGGGCGFEMQLEAVLKALWPYEGHDIDPATGVPYNPPRLNPPFFAIQTGPQNEIPNQYGNGGLLPTVVNGFPVARNASFLRNSAIEGISLVAIILVTDEDDCSSMTWKHLQNTGNEDPIDMPGLSAIPINLRCHAFKDQAGYLYPTDRYVKYLQMLRAESPELVIFAAITGVPENINDRLASVDLSDDAQREAFYTQLLADPSMQEQTEPMGKNLQPTCRPPGQDDGAMPARRIVEVARGFGASGVVQSICQDSFEPAINAIIDVIANQLSDVCLPRALVRKSSGKVGCRVVWELPTDPSTASADAPRSCQDKDFLSSPEKGPLQTKAGAIRCDVTQLQVEQKLKPSTGQGWYYDDFSDERGKCKQRVAFTELAVPPNGVVVALECLNETQSVKVDAKVNQQAYLNMNREPPAIGSPCEGDDGRCSLLLNDGTTSNALFCHWDQNICVMACGSDADCPPAWVCDQRPAQTQAAGGAAGPRAFCVNPTCGTE